MEKSKNKNVLYKRTPITKKSKDGLYTMVISDSRMDREKDVVNVNKWNLENYKKNPVILWQHDTSNPVGKSVKMWKHGGQLKTSVKLFTEAPVEGWVSHIPHPTIIAAMIDGGYINAGSAGYLPDWDKVKYGKGKSEDDPARYFDGQELLEHSFITLPSNPGALIECGICTEKQCKNYGWLEKEVEEEKETEEITFDEDEYIDKEMVEKPLPGEHSCRLTAPNYDSYARKNCYKKSDGKCIDFVFGIKEGKSEVQSLRFPVKSWPESEAKAYCEKKDGIKFEPAKKEESSYNDEIKTLLKSIKKTLDEMAGNDDDEEEPGHYFHLLFEDEEYKKEEKEGEEEKEIGIDDLGKYLIEKNDTLGIEDLEEMLK